MDHYQQHFYNILFQFQSLRLYEVVLWLINVYFTHLCLDYHLLKLHPRQSRVQKITIEKRSSRTSMVKVKFERKPIISGKRLIFPRDKNQVICWFSSIVDTNPSTSDIRPLDLKVKLLNNLAPVLYVTSQRLRQVNRREVINIKFCTISEVKD